MKNFKDMVHLIDGWYYIEPYGDGRLSNVKYPTRALADRALQDWWKGVASVDPGMA